ncbi:Spy/CpxP family protein refolding chaperone [Pseudoalteromonas shioyasakiensis]|uniref:Spy/CpxP family protein refolding chaperone n=1 Tax=Pseudoalteromonas shioyasakiensis TaxID=1190813 RepID=UPI002118D7D7|nr:Spy/CpxP family protein refolding chaperone [Pseudoalteromonas shioyasakiensis]MCQ8879584.1 Spy/CpxP family protein refolding chaperone [Pseudoalteromonas shioyasakiensis]
MITRKLSKLVLICGLATATLGTGVALAKGGMHHGKGMHEARFLLSERGAEKLDLTQEQQTQLKAAFEAQKEQMKAMRGDKDARKVQREAFKAKMDVLLAKATFDENAAQELLDSREAKAEKFAMQKLKMEHTVWQILNAEQREKYSKMKKRFAKKMKDKGQRKGKRGDKKADETTES